MIEKDNVYAVETEVADLNEKNILKPYAYQKYFAQVVERHLRQCGVNALMEKTPFVFILITMSFELKKPVKGCVEMYANTWYSQRTGPYFRREAVFRDGNGDILFQASSFSILFDAEKKAVYRGKGLPFELFPPDENLAIKASPVMRVKADFSTADTRRVQNSHIDRNGHVNNCRYGEFAYDVLTDDERNNLRNIRRIDINFASELKNGDAFSVQKACEGHRIFVRGCLENSDKKAFDLVFNFKTSQNI